MPRQAKLVGRRVDLEDKPLTTVNYLSPVKTLNLRDVVNVSEKKPSHNTLQQWRCKAL